VGQIDVPVTIPLNIGVSSGLSCGVAIGSPVTTDYEPPFKFTGKIHSVIVDISGDLIHDREAEMRMIMARQ
jgi:arylsulfatase